MSTTTHLSNSVRARYLDAYVRAAMARQVYEQFCYPISQDREKLQRNSSVVVPFLSHMSPGTTAISETTDVTPVTLDDATASITPTSRWGAIQDSEKLLLTNYTDYGAARFMTIGDNLTETLEAYLSSIALAGNVSFSAAARASLDAGTSGNTASHATFAEAARYLYGLKAPAFVDPVNGQGSFAAILHPDAYYDLRVNSPVTDIAKYQQASILLNGEVGMVEGFRIVSSPWAKVFGGAGADNASAAATTLSAAATSLATTISVASASNLSVGSYLTIGTEETGSTHYANNERVKYVSESGTTITIAGSGANGGLKYDHASGVAVRNADSVYPILFGTAQSIAKVYAAEVGEFGEVVGPLQTGLLNQFVSLGWKWYGAYAIINQNWLVRAEVSSSLDA